MSWSAFPLTTHPAQSQYQQQMFTLASRPSAGSSSLQQRIKRERDTHDLPHLYSLGSAHAESTDIGWHWSRSRSTQSAYPTPIEPPRQPLHTAVRPTSSISSDQVRENPMAADTLARNESTVYVPQSLKRLMAEVAVTWGRSESDLWAEAARAWLDNYRYDQPDDEPPPPTSAALAIPRPTRSWAMIDEVLSDLRTASHLRTDTCAEHAA